MLKKFEKKRQIWQILSLNIDNSWHKFTMIYKNI